MRTLLFKNEIDYLFLRYNIEDGLQQAIIDLLFENPFKNYSIQYLLKQNYFDEIQIEEALKSLIKDKNTVGAIKSLFIVKDDLNLPII